LQPDIIHFQDSAVWLNLALMGTTYRKLIHVHGRPIVSEMRWFDRFLNRMIIGSSDGAVCITNGARETVAGLGWAKSDNCWTLYNSIDSSAYSDLPTSAEARKRLALPANAHLLGMVCRLVPEKGCRNAIDLLRRLPSSWHLVFCGDGPLRPELERRSRATGLAERIHFLGALGDVRPVYAALDAYLFLTEYEPFGLVIGEAMAAGVPVFGWRRAGEYSELRKPLVTPDNSIFIGSGLPANASAEGSAVLDKLASAIEICGDCPQAYSNVVATARRWVMSTFSPQEQADSARSLYERALAMPVIRG